jgi:Uri superfamily endonuclease
MIDPEFGKSDETCKSPLVFAQKKNGIEDHYWEMTVSYHCHTTISDLDPF